MLAQTCANNSMKATMARYLPTDKQVQVKPTQFSVNKLPKTQDSFIDASKISSTTKNAITLKLVSNAPWLNFINNKSLIC